MSCRVIDSRQMAAVAAYAWMNPMISMEWDDAKEFAANLVRSNYKSWDELDRQMAELRGREHNNQPDPWMEEDAKLAADGVMNATVPTEIQCLKWVQAIQYNCGTDPNYKGSDLEKNLNKILHFAIQRLPGYAEASWIEEDWK